MRPSLFRPFLSFAFYFSSALSFNVAVGSSPTQCGPLNVTWTGGRAPFQIMLIPVYNIPRNMSVPSTSFNNNQGSYQIPYIPFLEGAQFLLTMSDSTGFGTGGTSELLTVGAPVGGASCNTTNPSLPFSFGLPSSLQQCSLYTFDEYSGATLPITIAGLIPGGESFLLHTPTTGTSFSWVADVAAGTTIIFTLTDAQGNSGGSSDTEIVTLSNDASCLNANSPSSTVSFMPSSTSTVSSSSTSSSTPTVVSTGTIIGVASGVVLGVAAMVVLGVYYLRRLRYRRLPYGLAPSRKSRRPDSVELDPGVDNFQHPPIYPFPYQSDSANHLPPPIIADTPASTSYLGTSLSTDPSLHTSGIPYALQQHSRASSNSESFAAFGDIASSSMSSSGRRKAAMAGMSTYQPTTRFIVHTDVDDQFPEGEAEVVELPPQYSERRTPVTGLAGERPVSSLMGLSSTNGQHVDELPQPTSHRPLE